MRRIFFFMVIIVCIIIYVFLINIVAESILIYQQYREVQITSTSMEHPSLTQKISMGLFIGISVKRPRIYGTIIEDNDQNSKLFLYINPTKRIEPRFLSIPLPLEYGGVGYRKFHVIFLIIIIFFIWRNNKVNKSKKGGSNARSIQSLTYPSHSRGSFYN